MCGVIVVDAGRSRSTWHERDAYVHDHCLRCLHNYALFYEFIGSNLFTHRNTCYLERSHSWNLWPLGLFSIIFAFRFHIIESLLLFWNLHFPIYTTKIPKIFILLSLLDLTFASDREGIDNPFIALVARFLIVCAGNRQFACSLLLDWYLGSQKLREILTLLCCITLSSSRENQSMLKR